MAAFAGAAFAVGAGEAEAAFLGDGTDAAAVRWAGACSTGLVAVVGSVTAPPRAAEVFTVAPGRAPEAAFGSAARGALALVLSAVFAVLAADLAGEVFTAAVFAADRTGPVDLVGDFAETLALLTASAVEAGTPARTAFETPESRPLERPGAAVTLAALVLSFFLADGIRRALLLRPAVETGRITDLPPGRDSPGNGVKRLTP
ncbi:MAG: hypothetical protein ACR652_19490 [Methylocystis sp.]|uniref:hypothetical protein n=1 Tax=Methylocystis sp. TaxID=1911079 RepID=UPI003DA3AE11